MRIAVFSTKTYDEDFFVRVNREQAFDHGFSFLETRLTCRTASLAKGFPAVCVFVNDQVDRRVIQILASGGVKMIALRCAGFNNVDLQAAEEHGMTVARVPAYSPNAVAEHTVGLILAVCRKLHKAYNRTREGNFSLEGLLGFDLAGKTAGVIGTGKIGAIVAKILQGFGCRVLAYDMYPNDDLAARGIEYASLDDLFQESDIVTLHCPLTPETRHLIDEATISRMKPGVLLANTSRGALVDTGAVIEGLKSGKIGSLALDVYEEEADLFFEDCSSRVIQDDVFARLLTFPNVIITGHQAFFTEEALEAISLVTLRNITAFEKGETPEGLVTMEMVRG